MAVKSSDRAALKWIYANTRGLRLRMLSQIVGSGMYAACSVVFALMCRGIVDGAVQGEREAIISSAAGLLGVILAMLLLQLFCNSTGEYIKARLETDMRGRILASLLKKECADTSAYHSGELQNRMFSDVTAVTDGVIGILPSFVNMVTRLAGAAIVLLILDHTFALVFIGAGLVLFTTALLLRKRIKHLHKDVQEKLGKERSFLQETLESLLVVKSFGAEKKILRINQENREVSFRARMKRRTVTILANAGFSLVFRAGYLYAIVWGAVKILDNSMSYGTLTAILQLVNQIQQPFAELSSLLPRFYAMTASAERIIELQSLPDEAPPKHLMSYDEFESVSFDNVCFSYGSNDILRNVSISINKGEIVSLTGISGGGKSTLFLLMLGAYSPQSGEVVFNSSRESFTAGTQTRPLLGYVPQGNRLFSGTVRENIAFLREDASEEEILHAAETACAAEFISALPDGMDTVIGEHGFGISEGQAQRIAVARAILGGAPILLLDEATSALDEQTEAQLLKNIASLSNKTVLIVTHRRAVLDICDKHIVIKDGEVSYGTI